MANTREELAAQRKQKREARQKRKETGEGVSGAFTIDGEQIQRIRKIEIDKIEYDPHNPRKIISDSEIEDLAASIKNHGLETPIHIREEGDKYILISGERRLRASKHLGLIRIDAIIKEHSTKAASLLSYVDNIERKGISGIEEALFFKQQLNLIDGDNKPIFANASQLAKAYAGDDEKRYNTMRAKISTYLKIAELPQSIIDKALDGGYFIVRVMEHLQKAELDKVTKETIYEKLCQSSMNREQSIAFIDKHIKKDEPKTKKPKIWGEYKVTKKKSILNLNRDEIGADLLSEFDAFIEDFMKRI